MAIKSLIVNVIDKALGEYFEWTFLGICVGYTAVIMVLNPTQTMELAKQFSGCFCI